METQHHDIRTKRSQQMKSSQAVCPEDPLAGTKNKETRKQVHLMGGLKSGQNFEMNSPNAKSEWKPGNCSTQNLEGSLGEKENDVDQGNKIVITIHILDQLDGK